ncbi:MAG: hypothetical protein IIC28_05950 [Chloroflexi bacterium]|nr:hypothetical protein [Chloroflexota bacterium]
MKKRLVIDSQLAAQDPAGVFDGDWSWPVAQSEYDDPITEFIEWSDELHSGLSNSPRLLDAFFLSKAVLLKDLSYLSAAWVDITISDQHGFAPVYDADKYLYRMVQENSYPRVVPSEVRSIRKPVGFRRKVREWAARYGRRISDRRALRSSVIDSFSIGGNELTRQIAPSNTRRLRLTHDELIRARPAQAIPHDVAELAKLISSRFSTGLEAATGTISLKFAEYIHWLVKKHLSTAWNDAGVGNVPNQPPQNSRLFTGTGGGYAARLMAYRFCRSGLKVLRTTHGGDSPLFDDVMLPSVEFPFASTYVAFGELGARSLADSINKRTESVTPDYAKSVVAAGSKVHQTIRDLAQPGSDRKVSTVSVITGSFTGMYPVFPHMKLHDVVYMEWHRRLLAMVRDLGYRALSKRHPKGLLTDRLIFRDVAHDELINTPMSAVQESTDAYVIDLPASAFMEALCTMKPVIVIDIPIRRMRASTRAQISKSVEFISASFDDRNRVVINQEELRTGLEKPVDIDAREQLIQDYLLRPSTDFGSFFE